MKNQDFKRNNTKGLICFEKILNYMYKFIIKCDILSKKTDEGAKK